MRRTYNMLDSERLRQGIIAELPFEIEIPTCYYCKTDIEPKTVVGYYIKYNNNNNNSSYYYICSSHICNNCSKIIFAEHISSDIILDDNCCQTKLLASPPTYRADVSHSEKIKEISPKFIQIYDESYTAEKLNLIEICGLGYRKALEFLIKDYAITLYSEQEDKIKKMSLSDCISKYFNDEYYHPLIKASTRLGNDEAHYIRKYDEYTLDDLKSFINLTEILISAKEQILKANSIAETNQCQKFGQKIQ